MYYAEAMSKRLLAIVVFVLSLAVWIPSFIYLHNSYQTGNVEKHGNMVMVTRELNVDRRTGRPLGPESFLEARQGAKLILLTLVLAIVNAVVLVRSTRRK